MKRVSFGFLFTLTISCCRMLLAADTTPPELVSIGLSLTNLDVSDSNQTILVTARITDDLSGVGVVLPGGFIVPGVSVTFLSPSRNQHVFGFGPGRASGSGLDGIYTNGMVLPRYSESGLWTVQQVFMQDAAGNSRTLDYAALLRLGISAQFYVTGTSDTTPPQFVTFGFSPNTIDAGSSNRIINFTTRLRDDLSGLGDLSYCGSAEFRSPSGSQGFGVAFVGLGRISGDTRDGTYTNAAVLPQFCEPGTWTLENLSAFDVAGNDVQLYRETLLALGFPMALTVTGIGDTNAPIIAGFSLTPTNVNTSLSAESIEITTHVTDDLSGFGRGSGFNLSILSSVSATFASPSGRQSAGLGLGPSFSTPGVLLDAVFTNTVALPRYSEPGLWMLQSLTVTDNVGNRRLMDLAAVRNLGLPFSFMVEEFPELRIRISEGATIISWPASANGFSLQTSASCSDPAAWNDAPGATFQIGEERVIAFSLAAGQRYYRLIKRP